MGKGQTDFYHAPSFTETFSGTKKNKDSCTNLTLHNHKGKDGELVVLKWLSQTAGRFSPKLRDSNYEMEILSSITPTPSITPFHTWELSMQFHESWDELSLKSKGYVDSLQSIPTRFPRSSQNKVTKGLSRSCVPASHQIQQWISIFILLTISTAACPLCMKSTSPHIGLLGCLPLFSCFLPLRFFPLRFTGLSSSS